MQAERRPRDVSAVDLRAAIGPRVRTSPFFTRTVAAGLTSVSTYNHMWLPMSYGDPDEEYRRLTTGVTMWDVAAQRHVEVSGPDADDVVQRMTVIDTAAVEIGAAAHAPMVDHDGRLINDPILLHVDLSSWRFSIADGDVRLWIDATARADRCRCEVHELDTATIAIQGPDAAVVMDGLGLAQANELGVFRFRRAVLAGVDVIVSRSGWSNQGGFELFIDRSDRAGAVWDLVASAGAVADIGMGAPHPSERIEHHLFSYGTDTGYDADPFEVGLGHLVDFDAGDFVGRSALERLAQRPPRRRLVGVVLDGERMQTLGWPHPALVDERHVGMLRAAAWSPRYQHNLGLALIDASVGIGEHLVIEGHDTVHTGSVVELPFADLAEAPR